MDVEGITYEPKGKITSRGKVVNTESNHALHELSKIMSLCNLSNIHKSANGVWERVGESTEAALKVLVEKLGIANMSCPGSDTPCCDSWTRTVSVTQHHSHCSAHKTRECPGLKICATYRPKYIGFVDMCRQESKTYCMA